MNDVGLRSWFIVKRKTKKKLYLYLLRLAWIKIIIIIIYYNKKNKKWRIEEILNAFQTRSSMFVYDHCVYISYAHTVIKIGYRNNTITSLAVCRVRTTTKQRWPSETITPLQHLNAVAFLKSSKVINHLRVKQLSHGVKSKPLSIYPLCEIIFYY